MKPWQRLLAALLLLAAGGVATAATPVQSHGASKRLLLLLHSFAGDAARMAPIAQALLDDPQGADTDVLAPELPFGVFSTATPDDVLAGLLADIDAAWAQREARGQPYEGILLVGHSLGSLYARKLYVAASGETAEAPFEPGLKRRLEAIGAASLAQPRPWAAAVQRVVLLAGLNRGWTVSHHMSLTRGVWMSAGVWLGRLLEATTGRQFIVMTAHRGAPFVTQLRLQWLAMRQLARDSGGRLGAARVVQLLGTTDDLVPPSDNVDPVTGSDFGYLEVPRSGHADVVQLDDAEAGPGRREVVLCALLDEARCPQATRRIGQVLDESLRVDPQVTDVLFVVHGIRDEGYWTEKVAQRVLARARERGLDGRFAVETSSYGYFPMLSFLRPGARQEKVEWLMDRYTTARARFPNAKRFSFVGHSHGTYLLARALSDYPAVRFHHVVFAGSVVHRDYAWNQVPRERASGVFNFVASADWVVAFFPNALQQMQVQDLGSAGHDGFAAESRAVWLPAPEQYVVGGHSAALAEPWWDAIAGLVLDGRFEPPPGARLAQQHAWWVGAPAQAAPLIWVAIALLLLWGLVRLLRSPMREWKKTLAVLGYCGLVWLIVTEV
ncbi:MAG: hypothetical protein KF788_09905 [Piscinibacter sp.]|nr:hypothetical protein [Piscinibacter sp.]